MSTIPLKALLSLLGGNLMASGKQEPGLVRLHAPCRRAPAVDHSDRKCLCLFRRSDSFTDEIITTLISSLHCPSDRRPQMGRGL